MGHLLAKVSAAVDPVLAFIPAGGTRSKIPGGRSGEIRDPSALTSPEIDAGDTAEKVVFFFFFFR